MNFLTSIIGQYLSQINESATVVKSKKNLYLNKASSLWVAAAVAVVIGSWACKFRREFNRLCCYLPSQANGSVMCIWRRRLSLKYGMVL